MVVFLAGALGDHVFQHCPDGQPLNTLCAPVGRDLAGVSAPELFGVAFEEHPVQHLAEPVDVEVFQIGLRLFRDARTQIAESGFHGGGKAHALDGVLVHGHRIVEEVLVEVDAGDPVTHQHDHVVLFRIGAAFFQGLFPSQLFVVIGRRPLNGHQIRPPLHNGVVLGEESVTADVHAVAVIAHRLGDTAQNAAFLQDRYVIFVFGILEQFICRRQTSRTAA